MAKASAPCLAKQARVVVVVMLFKNKDWFLWGGVGGALLGEVWSSHTLLIGKGGS